MQSTTLLAAVLRWTGSSFGTFDVLIGDFIHRHNRQALQGESEDDAVLSAMAAGAAAAQRVRDAADGERINGISILSCRPFYTEPTFGGRVAELRQQYETKSGFASAVDDAVDVFLKRKDDRKLFDPAARNHCVAYQLEEIALFEALVRQGFTIHVYPGSHLPALKKIVAGELPEISSDLAHLGLFELKF